MNVEFYNSGKGINLTTPELVKNGTFTSNRDGWIADNVDISRDTTIFTNGGLKIEATGNTDTRCYTELGNDFVVGQKYILTVSLYSPINASGARAIMAFAPAQLTNATAFTQRSREVVETFNFIFTATSTTHRLYFSVGNLFSSWGSTGDVAYADNISVRKVPLQYNGLLPVTYTPNGFTKLGNDAPSIKMKKLTGTTASAQGGTITVAHGLTASKIISINALVQYGAAGHYTMPGDLTAGYQFYAYSDTTNINLRLGGGEHTGSSANILSKPFTVLITYEE
jgi:hypothetical protein